MRHSKTEMVLFPADQKDLNLGMFGQVVGMKQLEAAVRAWKVKYRSSSGVMDDTVLFFLFFEELE